MINFTTNLVPLGFQQSFEGNGGGANENSHLVYAAGAWYYLSVAQVGTVENTNNLWIVKSTDGVNWSLVFNGDRGFTGGFKFIAVAQSGSTVYIHAWPKSPNLPFQTSLFTFNAGPDTFSGDQLTPLFLFRGGSFGIQTFADGSVLVCANSDTAFSDMAVARYAGGVWSSIVVVESGNASANALTAMASQVTANRIYLLWLNSNFGITNCITIDNTLTLGTNQVVENLGIFNGSTFGLGCIEGSDTRVTFPALDHSNNIIVYRAPCGQNPVFTKEKVQPAFTDGESIVPFRGITAGGSVLPVAALSLAGVLFVFYGTTTNTGPTSTDCVSRFYYNSNQGAGWNPNVTLYTSVVGLQPWVPYPFAASGTLMGVLWGTFNGFNFFFGAKYNSFQMILFLGQSVATAIKISLRGVKRYRESEICSPDQETPDIQLPEVV